MTKLVIPIPFEIYDYIKIPKHLFPYNEEWLECALAYMFEEEGYSVALEPSIRISVLKPVRYMGVSLPEAGYRRRTVKIKPDIILLDKRIIIEVENFYKIPITNIFKQAYDYERKIGLITFVATWKALELKKHLNEKYGEWELGDRLIMVDPLTGELEASDLFYETMKYGGPEPEYDIQIEYPTKGSPTHHRRIQYEMFTWFIRNGMKISLEIPISRDGKIYAPNGMKMSREDGFIEWIPRGWWSYALEGRPADAQVDIISMDKQGIIRGYEVKTTKDLADLDKNRKAYSRLMRELTVMYKSKLFNEVFLCVPTREVGEAAADDLSESPIGVIALIEPYKFEIYKNSEYIGNINYKTLHIDVADGF